MKTTLEIPDDLFRRTKAEAALRGRPMKDLVVEALEEKLRTKAHTRTPSGWRSVFGRASRAAVRDVDGRLREMERIDTDDWK